MIPITRIEKYINEIVGNGDTAPDQPITREEIFYAAILGEVPTIPTPITNEEKYLSAIANNYTDELPQPVTRIEKFLARAAGMDVTIPTPITREEMFWADYALIVEKELSGIPPLTFNAIAGTLKNYRIYGNTVNSESVGDRTENLFDGDFLQGYWAYADGAWIQSGVWIATKKIPCKSSTTYTFSFSRASRWYGFIWFDSNGNYISANNQQNNSSIQYRSYSTMSPPNATYMVIDIAGYPDYNSTILPNDITDFMLVENSTALPYEPYGYRVPVTINNVTTNLYLPEQIRKIDDEAEYIDFKAQKQYFADGTSVDVGLLALSTIAGTNALTVGAEIQPSNVYIKYEGAR